MIDDPGRRLPSSDDISAPARRRANALKDEFLARHTSAQAKTTEFRETYRHLFSKNVLPTVPPADLKYFANANIGAAAGNMSVFNTEWNTLGEGEAASRVRGAIDHLLYGSEGTQIEDRLTDLIDGKRGFGMKGFREALLTKVLCMVEPWRFVPIFVYTGKAGKKEYTTWVYGLDLPSPKSV
jgi:hypothetical protein